MIDHSIFRLGDVVHMNHCGHIITGTIYSYNRSLTLPIRVAFVCPYRGADTIIKNFTNDGRTYEGGDIVLYR